MDNRSVPSSPTFSNHSQEQNAGNSASSFPFPSTSPPQSGQGYSVQAHVLIDPVTGQHYIVPQPFYPPIQPMYYPPPAPPGHFLYQYPPNRTAGSPIFMGMPPYGNSQQRPERPNTSTERNDQSEEEKANTSETNDDGNSSVSNISPSPYNYSYMYHNKLQKTPSAPRNGDGPTSSKNSPVLGSDRSFNQSRSPQVNYFLSKLRNHKNFERPSEGEQTRSTQSDYESTRASTNFLENRDNSSMSDVEHRRYCSPAENRPQIQKEEPKKAPVSKSIKMEINLDDVPTIEEVKPARRSTATAFTVNLGDEKNVSLQEAARNLAESRRSKLKKAGRSTFEEEEKSRQYDGPPVETNKNYLLEKLLTGENHNDSNNTGNEDSVDTPSVTVNENKDTDSRSEALTFVIDTSNRPNRGLFSQGPTKVIYSDDDDSSSGSESIYQESNASTQVSKKENTIQKPVQPESSKIDKVPNNGRRLSRPTLQANSMIRSAQEQSKPKASPKASLETKKDFMEEFAKLRVMAGLPAYGPTNISKDAPKSTPFRRGETRSARETQSNAEKIDKNPVRRSFNSRTRDISHKDQERAPCCSRRQENKKTVPSSPQLQNRPPFRTGAPRGICFGQSEEQRVQEMTAWLRRKDYNPMKSAAAGRRTSEQKTKEQQFTSRRSMTFHTVGNESSINQSPTTTHRSPRNRSQEPRDMRHDRSRLSGRRTEQPKLSGLAKAVDILSEKCKKSIELIRQQNKGCLSVSVEDLLTAAAEPSRPNESLDEQLERLSDAFDAVQRYLEQYSLDEAHSAESYFDIETHLEDDNSYRNGESNEDQKSISSSYRRKVLDS